MAIIKWNRWGFPSVFDDSNWPTLSNWNDIIDFDTGGIDIYETDDSVIVEAQVPGIKEEDVEVTIEGNVLTINASKEETEEEKDKKKTVYKSTRQYCFNYSTNLPRMVKGDKAEAEVENGVVKVTVPKIEEEKPKKIEVKKKSK